MSEFNDQMDALERGVDQLVIEDDALIALMQQGPEELKAASERLRVAQMKLDAEAQKVHEAANPPVGPALP